MINNPLYEKPAILDSACELSPAIKEFFVSHPDLAEYDNHAWLNILNTAHRMTIDPGTTLLQPSIQCKNFIFLTEGVVRVFQLAENGREITLYRSHPGDICVMSLNSLVNQAPFSAMAISETPVKALSLNEFEFHAAMGVSQSFRTRVLQSLASNFQNVLEIFHDTAFLNIDSRLACLLGRLFERNQSDTLHVTHAELANELGTSREVVSRTLKQLELQGCLELSRGQIKLGTNANLP